MPRLHATGIAAAVLVAATFQFLQAETGPRTVLQEEAKRAPTPLWQLPYESAAKRALAEKRPLLLVSLNGNLDGYC